MARRTTSTKVGRAVGALTVGAIALAACSSSGSDGAADGEKGVTTTVAGGTDGGEFSLLSYNVAGLPAEISKVRPDLNIPQISPKLNDYDVVITQEDFDWWKPDGLASKADFVNYHGRLRKEATHEYQTERHPGPEAVGIDIETDRPEMELGDGLGVLSRFPIADTERVPWTDCEGGFTSGASDCLAMKGFLLTRMTLADGAVVDLYDLHGEAGGGERDQALQAADFEQLAAFIQEQSKGNAVILGGDTNLHTDLVHEDSGDGKDVEIWADFLEATGLTDACAATDCGEEGRIDKVAYRSGGGVDLEATSHRVESDVFVDANGEQLSDHEAVAVDFTWSPS